MPGGGESLKLPLRSRSGACQRTLPALGHFAEPRRRQSDRFAVWSIAEMLPIGPEEILDGRDGKIGSRDGLPIPVRDRCHLNGCAVFVLRSDSLSGHFVLPIKTQAEIVFFPGVFLRPVKPQRPIRVKLEGNAQGPLTFASEQHPYLPTGRLSQADGGDDWFSLGPDIGGGLDKLQLLRFRRLFSKLSTGGSSDKGNERPQQPPADFHFQSPVGCATRAVCFRPPRAEAERLQC